MRVRQTDFAALGVRTASKASWDTFMQPFDYSLWGLIFAVVVGLAATLALLESLWPDDATIHGGGGGGGVTWRRVARLLYHSFAANLQVDDD